MTDAQAKQMVRAMEICERDGLRAVRGTAKDGRAVYAVASRTYANHYYLLFVDGGRIRCQCHAAQVGKICAHAAAVRSLIVAEREERARQDAKARETSFVTRRQAISMWRS